MSFVIDRRLNAKNKSMVNRQRFLRRYRQHIKKAVADAVGRRSITDMNKGEQISIPTRDISEPLFHHGQGGKQQRVLPGNDQFMEGDKIPRPPGGGGAGGSGESGASNQGEGMDDFVFQITQEEFLDFMFEDLELPNLVKRQLSGNEEFVTRRAGFSNQGAPGQINIVRSLKAANARRIALTGGKRRRLQELLEELKTLQDGESIQSSTADESAAPQTPYPIGSQLEPAHPLDQRLTTKRTLEEVIAEIEDLRKRLSRVPWLDDFDLKYNLQIKEPVPRSKAVMFCLMDVSGSMSQATKDMAKRFFILLYLFLQRNYQHTEVVFIRHHTSAKEVDEQEFFYSRETGGTIVSSALHLMKEILEERFPLNEWNVYGAQASDGDNWNDDSSTCSRLLMEEILPKVQFYSYIEITPRQHQALWEEYESVLDAFPDAFAMQQIIDVSDIYPVFRQLFHKKTA